MNDGEDWGPVLSSVEIETPVEVTYEVLPGDQIGPAGLAHVHGVVTDVSETGSPDRTGRYRTTFVLRDESGETTIYRLRYRRGVLWIQQATNADSRFEGGMYGRSRRVYAIKIEGDGITVRKQRENDGFIIEQ